MFKSKIKEAIQKGAFIIDVRSPEEFSEGFYPNAKNIPISKLPYELEKIPKGKALVVYCASGGRSAIAKEILSSNGFSEVHNAGGLSSMPR